MTSNHQLFLILIVFYLYECFVSINKKGSLVGRNIVYDFLNRKGVFHFGKKLYLFAGLFNFGRNTYVLMPAALTLAEDGVLTDCLDSCRKFYYDSLERVLVEGSFLVLNGSYVDCGSERYALYCKKIVNDCKALGFKKRTDYINKLYKKSSNVSEILDVISSYKSVSRLITVTASLIFFAVFMVFPVLVFRNFFETVWVYFLLVYLILILFQIMLGIYVLRKIYIISVLKIIGESLTILVSPLSAIRLVSHLSKNLLVQYHPAAVYIAVNNKESSEKYIFKYYRYVYIKLQAEHDNNKKEYFENERKILLKLMEQNGFDSDKLWHEPEKESDNILSFCPVCHEQYVKTEAYCCDCRLKTQIYIKKTITDTK